MVKRAEKETQIKQDLVVLCSNVLQKEHQRELNIIVSLP